MEALELDELLQAIHDVEVSVFIGVTDVTGVKPSVCVYSFRRCRLVVQVARHHLWAADPDFAVFTYAQVIARFGVDNAAFG